MRTFEGFLQDIPSPTKREQVLLAMYYLQAYNNEDNVTITDIHALFNISNIQTSESSITSYLQYLYDSELVVTTNDGISTRLRLSHKGHEKAEKLAEEGNWLPSSSEITTGEMKEYFLEIEDEVERLNSKIEEINSSSQKWRRNTWIWRIAKIITGLVTASISIKVILLIAVP